MAMQNVPIATIQSPATEARLSATQARLIKQQTTLPKTPKEAALKTDASALSGDGESLYEDVNQLEDADGSYICADQVKGPQVHYLELQGNGHREEDTLYEDSIDVIKNEAYTKM